MIQLTIEDQIAWISLQRSEKRNAMNEVMLTELQQSLQSALENSKVHALILCAEGTFFSAGADLASMQAAATLSPTANEAQAQQLADVLTTWYQSPKPTLCLVQGPAFGGALGFIAASDYVIASPEAKFCFSEAKLGLIPAVISPYILATIGFKTTKRLFLSAEQFDVYQAEKFGLVDEIIANEALKNQAFTYVKSWLNHPPATLGCIKAWLQTIKDEKIGPELGVRTAKKLAEVRMTPEAQIGLMQFLQKNKNKDG